MTVEDVVDNFLVVADRCFEDSIRKFQSDVFTDGREFDLDAVDRNIAQAIAQWAVQRPQVAAEMLETLAKEFPNAPRRQMVSQ